MTAHLIKLSGSPGCFVCDNNNSNDKALHLNLFWDKKNHEVHIPFCPEASWCGFQDVVHGGILAAILDEAMAWAVQKQNGGWAFTADFHLRYKKPVTSGSNYIAIAKVKQYDARRIKADGYIRNSQGYVVATADAIFLPPAESNLQPTPKSL